MLLMGPREELLALRELLAAPGAWCQGTLARDASGKPVGWCTSAACSRCLVGWSWFCTISFSATVALEGECTADGFNRIAHFNDAPNRTHLEVIELIERAALRFGEEA